MPFSESIKLEAKRRSAFRCCICQATMVEVHHLVPQSLGGGDSLENAAPLCARCHDVYGGNPEKRKQIRQARDHWWEMMRERRANLTFKDELEQALATNMDVSGGAGLSSSCVALYHCVFAEETFGVAVDMLMKLVHDAQRVSPGVRRLLYLDIEGHRNSEGGFDEDMFELQRHFILGCLSRYVAEVHLPLGTFASGRAQRNDVPEGIEILPSDPRAHLEALKEAKFAELYVSDADKWIRVEG